MASSEQMPAVRTEERVVSKGHAADHRIAVMAGKGQGFCPPPLLRVLACDGCFSDGAGKAVLGGCHIGAVRRPFLVIAQVSCGWAQEHEGKSRAGKPAETKRKPNHGRPPRNSLAVRVGKARPAVLL